MKICLISSEFAPLAKTGGLADVAAALAAYLQRAGHDLRVLIPFYSSMDLTGFDVFPVDFLQDLRMQIGHQEVGWSIHTATAAGSDLSIYLLRCPELYERPAIYTGGADEHRRFILLSRAAIEMCQHMGFAPDIFHCHDWHTALIPLYLKTRYAWDRLFDRSRSVLTIHNIGYQGVFNASILPELGLGKQSEYVPQEDLRLGRVNFLRTGVVYADLLTTVSPTYAREILTQEYGMGLEDLLLERRGQLVGILNGIDTREWDPETDPLIPHHYTARTLAGKKRNKQALARELQLDIGDNRPLIGIVSRLTYQKGLELVQKVVPDLLERRPFALAVLGSGEPRYEQFFDWLQQRFPDRVHFRCGYDNPLAHRIEAGSDAFLMPSRFEPCGLNQMYSLRYGSVPIVRRTGGLADSVQPFDPHTGEGTGIVFEHYNDHALNWALNTALDLYADTNTWRRLVRNGMAMDYSWEHQGQIYAELFRHLVAATG